jgi:uncharacterized protein YjdB
MIMKQMFTFLRLLIVSALSILAAFQARAQQIAQIGTGTESPLTNNSIYSPICRFSASSGNDCSRSNLLYTATELATAGITNGTVINKIAFYKIGTGASTAPFQFEIWMRNSSTTAPLTATTWATITGTHSQVYNNTAQTISSASGWVEFTLSTPFTYTGQSLEIAMSHNMSAVAGNPTDGPFDWQYTNGFADYIIGTVSTTLTGVANLSGTVGNYKHRPNIQIHYGNGGPSTVTLTGAATMCVNTTTNLTGTPSGGTYSSSNTTVATVSSAGVVTALSPGTTTITYTQGSGSATHTITVNALPTAPAAITGDGDLCVGESAQLGNTSIGGGWSSSNSSIATINANGMVTGVGPGTAVISYTVTNAAGCTAAATLTVNVAASVIVGAITGDTLLCNGSTTTLSSTTSGGVWSSSNPSVATVNNSGVVQALSAGSTQIIYTVNGSSACPSTANQEIEVLPLPTPVISLFGGTLSTTGSGTYVWYLNGNVIPGANGATYQPSQSGSYTVKVIDANGCEGISAPFNFTGTGILNSGKIKEITVYPNPSTDFVNIALPSIKTVKFVGMDSRTYHAVVKDSRVDMRALPLGIYNMQAYGAAGELIGSVKVTKVK